MKECYQKVYIEINKKNDVVVFQYLEKIFKLKETERNNKVEASPDQGRFQLKNFLIE